MPTSHNGTQRAAAPTDAPVNWLENPQATQFVRTQDGYIDIPVVTVDADWLTYRADNGRILSEIHRACQESGLLDAEERVVEGDPRVQSILHKLLVAKASDETSPIFAELETHALQTEPLLITRQGLVVNGNRRLASMRELRSRDPRRYAAFTRVACAVLPEDLSHDTIEFIEANLQMAPDLKLDYGWINRRLKLREHVADLPRDLIVDAYRLRNAGEIDTELAHLTLVEAYLDYLCAPRDFQRVVDLEYYFLALHDELQKLKAAHIRELWTLAGFAMLAARADLDQPVEHYYPFTQPRPLNIVNWVMRTFAADRGATDPQARGDNEPMTPQIADRVRPILADPANALDVARHLRALIDTLKSNETELLSAPRVLSQLRAFRKAFENKGPSLLSERQQREIKAELVGVLSLLGGDDPAGSQPAPGQSGNPLPDDWKKMLGRLIRQR